MRLMQEDYASGTSATIHPFQVTFSIRSVSYVCFL